MSSAEQQPPTLLIVIVVCPLASVAAFASTLTTTAQGLPPPSTHVPVASSSFAPMFAIGVPNWSRTVTSTVLLMSPFGHSTGNVHEPLNGPIQCTSEWLGSGTDANAAVAPT